MLRKLLAALSSVGDLVERIEGLEESLEALEGRMDTDEARRIEWIGTVKRCLARINKAEQRDDGARGGGAEGHSGAVSSDYAEAKRLGLIGRSV